MDILRTVRLKLFKPSLEFYRESLDIFEIKALDKCEGSFHCRYKLPNAVLPRLHSRVILTTDELVYLTSKYDTGAIIPFNRIDNVEIDSGIFRIHTYDRKMEVQITNPAGKEFAELVVEAWKEYTGQVGENDDIEEEAEKIVSEIEQLEQERKDGEE